MAPLNLWTSAAEILLLGMIPCGIKVFKGHMTDRVIAFQMANTIVIIVLILLARGFSDSSFIDLSLTQTLLSLPGGLLFAHFLERRL